MIPATRAKAVPTMMRAWAGSLLKYRFPADAIALVVVLVEKSLVNAKEVLVDELNAAVVVLSVTGPGGINVPTRLLMAARIISEDTANVPEKNRVRSENARANLTNT